MRRDPAGAGERARPGGRGALGTGEPGPLDAGLPLRPRRQGHVDSAADAPRARALMSPRERIAHAIKSAAASGEPALPAYLTAGYPHPQRRPPGPAAPRRRLPPGRRPKDNAACAADAPRARALMAPRGRIAHAIKSAAASGEPALLAYLTAGYPQREVRQQRRLAGGGGGFDGVGDALARAHE